MTKRIRGEMANLEQLRISPLNSNQIGDIRTVLIKEIAFVDMCDLRVDSNSDTAKKVAEVIGVELPLNVGESAKSIITCLTLGPDWWLLIDADLLLIEKIAASTEGEFISLVDVSAQRTCLELTGPFAKKVLQHAWEGDLDDRGLAINACSQGLMARCPTIIHRTNKDTYRLYVRSSFAEHLYKFLVDAATEYLN